MSSRNKHYLIESKMGYEDDINPHHFMDIKNLQNPDEIKIGKLPYPGSLAFNPKTKKMFVVQSSGISLENVGFVSKPKFRKKKSKKAKTKRCKCK